ncbi:MAG TPA: cobyrinate a,c-diamide synthase [Aliidongia sp.]|nr:cobyrinate a,c-diamide synthase [Aliidongia sp.]
MVGPRGLVLAAPSSGSGKTIVTLGLLRALRRRGIDVAGAKVGPDYIDPGFHRAASGRCSVNLDPWAMRSGMIAGLIAEIRADLVLCEGVMGLFDGAGGSERGSTADLAMMTGWPVVLIVDARGQSASVAALLRGFATHRPGLGLAGVVFNRVASPRHGAMLEAAVRASLPDLAVLGAVPRARTLALPSRHLGLVLAEEHDRLDHFLEQAADLMAEWVDLDALQALARPARATAGGAAAWPSLGQRVALARDAAFAFAYPHLLDRWRAQGVEILPFSPLADEAPDEAADAVYLPGGYPELHAGRLASAQCFKAGLARAASRAAIIYGECGGYMALGTGLVDGEGVRHEMAGLLPVETSFAAPKRHLGYRQVAALAGPWRGQAFRAHEFHYATELEGEGPALFEATDAEGAALGAMGRAIGTVSGSFIHLIDWA